jgi:hypothetical protein
LQRTYYISNTIISELLLLPLLYILTPSNEGALTPCRSWYGLMMFWGSISVRARRVLLYLRNSSTQPPDFPGSYLSWPQESKWRPPDLKLESSPTHPSCETNLPMHVKSSWGEWMVIRRRMSNAYVALGPLVRIAVRVCG